MVDADTSPLSTPVRVRRLSDDEGRQPQQIVRRGSGKSDNSVVKWRRALVVLASAGGNDVAAIARLVHASPDPVREMIHRFNEMCRLTWTPSGRVTDPAGSRRLNSKSSSRRPPLARPPSASPSLAGASTSSRSADLSCPCRPASPAPGALVGGRGARYRSCAQKRRGVARSVQPLLAALLGGGLRLRRGDCACLRRLGSYLRGLLGGP